MATLKTFMQYGVKFATVQRQKDHRDKIITMGENDRAELAKKIVDLKAQLAIVTKELEELKQSKSTVEQPAKPKEEANKNDEPNKSFSFALRSCTDC